jgi:hypothetical protein
LWLAFLLVASGNAAAAGRQPQPAASLAPCLSCLVIEVDSADLAFAPGSLMGLSVLVHFARWEGAAETLEALSRRGATAGVVVVIGDPVPPTGVFERAALVGLTARSAGDADSIIFAARTLATAARAARPDVRIALDGDAMVRSGVPLDRVVPYTDAVVTEHPGAGQTARWVRGPTLEAPTVAALADASLIGGERVVVTVRSIAWHTLAELAALRATAVDVTGERPLDVGEIVARHQAQRRRQDEIIRRTIARGSTTLMFEVPGFVAPVTITAKTTLYHDGEATDIEQRDIRVNGAAIAGGDAAAPPQLPLVEPERVGTPPLTITLTDAYRYTLAGAEETNGARSYIVAFEPHGARQPLARGRAWIGARDFGLRRVEAVQTALRGPIVSSEQHEELGPFRVGGMTAWLPVKTRVFQMYEGAGHRTPIHRVIETPQYDVNPADFDTRLRAAHASSHLMLRETPNGLRYLLRGRDERGSAIREVSASAGQRVRTAVFGVLFDPNINVPLPFAGLSYVDLNLFETGAQLNAFFGGTYGQLSWSVPSLAGTRWQLQGRAFGIAARYNDRSFRSGLERYEENITQRPAHVSAGVVRPLTRRVRVRASYELDYTAFDRADTTAATFLVPVDAVVHALTLAADAEHGPWTMSLWWNPGRRQRWREWGFGAEPTEVGPHQDPLLVGSGFPGLPALSEVEGSGVEGSRLGSTPHRDFQRYGLLVSRTLTLGEVVGSRVQAAWMDSHDLDRFSRYSFNAFDNRLHGYPTASIRYDRGVIIRSVTGWNVRGWRVDGFADIAVVSDPGFGRALRGYPGIGAALEVGGPFRTLWSVDWGYGFRARRDDGRLGTQAVRVTAYRMF